LRRRSTRCTRAHPSLAAAVTGLTRRARRLLDERTTLVFGVARRQLIIDGVATDPDQPVLRRLAEGLRTTTPPPIIT